MAGTGTEAGMRMRTRIDVRTGMGAGTGAGTGTETERRVEARESPGTYEVERETRRPNKTVVSCGEREPRRSIDAM